jgi:hypothetical protein
MWVGNVSYHKQPNYFEAVNKHTANHKKYNSVTYYKYCGILHATYCFNTVNPCLLVWFTMHALMILHMTLTTKWLTAHILAQRLLQIVYLYMPLQMSLLTEWFITHIANILTFHSMCALMILQTILLTEWLIANIRDIWPLPTMCALMIVQTRLLSEWLIAHITAIWPVPSM